MYNLNPVKNQESIKEELKNDETKKCRILINDLFITSEKKRSNKINQEVTKYHDKLTEYCFGSNSYYYIGPFEKTQDIKPNKLILFQQFIEETKKLAKESSIISKVIK